MKKRKQPVGRRLGFCLLLVALCLAFTGNASAKGKGKVEKKGWVYENGSYKYYKDGAALKGVQQIGKKTYDFASNGAQRTGWQVIGGKYHYFRLKNKSKGYQVCGQFMDGIYLDAKGVAQADSTAARRKLALMAECQQLVQHVCSPSMSKSAKRRALFFYMMGNFTVRAIPDLTRRSDYDVAYAQWLLDSGAGDCYCFGALYAYLLNAIGYTNPLFVASGGHAWSEVGGKVYDPNWATVIGFEKCFGVPAYLSGVDGRPKWAQNRVYIFSVNDRPRD